MAIRLDHGTDELIEVHDINVVPFIDVMLVLLIIFMVAAPLATVEVPVDLPSSTAPPQQRPPKPIYLTLKADGSLTLGDNPISRAELPDVLATASGGNKDERIFLRGDRAVPYGDVMAVMNDLRDAGYLKVALVGMETR
ncbi:MAG TPA: TonB system transport protein ExbD [Xanthobacteraceae bacterium]|nr:TonB system transport protein ExbD [Xanthobacteraceae bacterium]